MVEGEGFERLLSPDTVAELGELMLSERVKMDVGVLGLPSACLLEGTMRVRGFRPRLVRKDSLMQC